MFFRPLQVGGADFLDLNLLKQIVNAASMNAEMGFSEISATM